MPDTPDTPDTDETILDVDGLEKTFGPVVAAQDITLSIRRNETVGIIGANGAGKTTFVNMVTGYLKPSAGTIRYRGRDVTRLGPRALTRVGLCRSFQVPQLFQTKTVFENVLLALGVIEGGWLPVAAPLHTDARAAEVDALLRQLSVLEFADQEVSALPQGVRKLVDVAVALAARPQMLMLDEPTSGISAEEKFGLMDIMMDALRGLDVTVLFIEHDMDIVARYAHRVLAFYSGRVIADGPPAAVLDDEQVKEYVIGTHLPIATGGPREAAASGRAG